MSGLEIHEGRLYDWDKGRILGRVVDNGPYGIKVVDDFERTVGQIRHTTMCGGTFLEFDERPSPLARPPLGPPPLLPPSGF